MMLGRNLSAKRVKELLQEVEEWHKGKKGSWYKRCFDRIHQTILKRGALSLEDLYDVAYWKSRRASKQVRTKNPDRVVRMITSFALKMPNERFKIRLLSTLEGIGVRRASAILAMSNPEKYGVMDENAWYALTGEQRSVFNDNDWIWYLREIRRLSKKFRRTPREIDLVLMKYGQLLYQKSKRRRR